VAQANPRFVRQVWYIPNLLFEKLPTRLLFRKHDAKRNHPMGIRRVKEGKLEMKRIAASVLAVSIALSASTAFAGGPVVIAEEPAVEAASPRSGWIVPVVVGLVLICAIACGGDDDDTAG
jgi:hypothetical protein